MLAKGGGHGHPRTPLGMPLDSSSLSKNKILPVPASVFKFPNLIK